MIDFWSLRLIVYWFAMIQNRDISYTNIELTAQYPSRNISSENKPQQFPDLPRNLGLGKRYSSAGVQFILLYTENLYLNDREKVRYIGREGKSEQDCTSISNKTRLDKHACTYKRLANTQTDKILRITIANKFWTGTLSVSVFLSRISALYNFLLFSGQTLVFFSQSELTKSKQEYAILM